MIIDKKLLKDWQFKSMGEIFTIERGGSPRPIADYITADPNGINWIKIGDTKGITKYIKSTKQKIKPEGLKKSRMVYEDDFILSNSMSFGKPFIMKSSGCIHDGWLVIRKNENINNDYLYLVLTSNQVYVQFSNLAKGSTVKNLNIEAVKKVIIPVPPIHIQRNIVSKVDELFSDIDKGIEDLKIAQQQLKTYRQSVLKYAFEGKLTNENVKEGNLPKGWEIVELGNVCSLITDGKHGDCENETNSGFYFLSAKDVKFDTLNYENSRQITKSGFNETHRRTNLKPGDICMVNTGASIGRIALAPNNDKTYKTTFQKSVAVIKTIPETLNNKYCSYVLKSDLKQLMKISSGTAVPNLLLGTIKKHTINIPPTLEEQYRIVQEIESRLSVADKMEGSINESLKQAEALRQSILKKAFSGELV